MRHCLILLAVLCSVNTSARADVIEFALGGPFPTLQAAIDAASDGDTIVVRAPFVLGFDIVNKGVEIVADLGGARVQVLDDNVVIQDTQAHQRVLLQGLELIGDADATLPGQQPSEGCALVVNNAQGPVRIADCGLTGAGSLAILTNFEVVGFEDGLPAAWLLNANADVSFVRCTLTGGKAAYLEGDLLPDDCYCIDTFQNGGEAIVAADTNLVLYDCTLSGGDSIVGEVYGGRGGHALRMLGGELFASGTSFTGGKGGFGSDGIVSYGGKGGDGVLTLFGTQSTFLDSQFTPGAPGGSTTGNLGPPGTPRSLGGLNFDLPGNARSLSIDSPAAEQQLAAFSAAGDPGDAVFVAAAFGDGALSLRKFSGSLMIELPWATLLPLGTVPAGGELAGSVTIPELGPGIDGLSLRLQAFFSAGPGATTLSSWTPLLALDSGF